MPLRNLPFTDLLSPADWSTAGNGTDSPPPNADGSQRHPDQMPRPPSEPSPPPPPPTSTFSFMSGNFDFPHASNSPPPPSRGVGTYDSFQQFLTRRDQERAHPAAGDSDDGGLPSRRPRGDNNRRRPLRRTLPNERDLRDLSMATRPPTSSASTSSTSNNRPRARPSDRYLRLQYLRTQQPHSEEMDDTADILDALADVQVPNPFAISTSATRARSPGSEVGGLRRQTKRRKLEHNKSPYDGFRYGYKGQVVQGRLRMEIVSCDGGEYDKHSSYGLYPVHNVLKNDKSVYCSQSSRCNLLLKHIGEMPFTLEKVVIRAPDRGFTAPVQEGLVFVAMSSDDLLAGTSSYKIDYASPSPPRSPTPDSEGDQQISLREAVSDPWIWNNSRHAPPESQEAVEDGIERLRLRSQRPHSSSTTRPHRFPPRSDRRNDTETSAPENCEEDFDLSSYDFAAGVSAPTPPPYSITTSSEAESSSSEEQPSAAIMADRLRRESRWRAESDDDQEDDLSRFPPLRRAYALDATMENYNEPQQRLRNARRLETLRGDMRGETLRATRLRTPSRIEVDEAGPPGSNEKGREGSGLITPNARFFIEKHKNKITIRFHPAISGKFILLKLWSPTHDGNIDIESVQFYGFSGPRYFPAIQPA